MPSIFGRFYTRDELRRQCGRIEQIAGITRYELQDGFERGVEVCCVKTGSGFAFEVCLSRGMDIIAAEHNGRSLCWQSSTGAVHPAFYEAQNFGWLRGFAGGLLTTCGLNSFGPACEDEGESYGIHDRASYLPASEVQTSSAWVGDDYELSVTGTMRQTRVFGPNLTLTRRISTRLGSDTLTIDDTIENDGFEPCPMVVLYHCNFGFPVVSPQSIVCAPSHHCEPRDEAAQVGKDEWMQMESPQAGYAERVYFHQMTPDTRGQVRAEIWNPGLNFGAFVSYRADELPFFTQWKMMGAGTYVCGLEPSNAPLFSRAELRQRDALPMLQPGETKQVRLELGVIRS